MKGFAKETNLQDVAKSIKQELTSLIGGSWMVTIQPRQIEVAVVHHSYRSMIVTFIKHDGHIDLDYAISISQIEQEARR